MSQQIAVRLSDELLADFDAAIALGAYESRAEAVRVAIEGFVAELRSKAVDRQITDGYGRIAQDPSPCLEFFAAIDEEPWPQPW
jgi:metal-responsive CopG/Arc/MetJ family transcriptional regulator